MRAPLRLVVALGGLLPSVLLAQPNLVVKEVTGPSTAAIGTSLPLTVTLENIGDADAEGSYLGFVLRPTPDLPPGVGLITEWWFDVIPAGQTSVVLRDVPIQPSVRAGDYHLVLKADGDERVDESDETDNLEFFGPISVAPGADLVSSWLFLPASAPANSSIEFSFELSNSGVGRSNDGQVCLVASTNPDMEWPLAPRVHCTYYGGVAPGDTVWGGPTWLVRLTPGTYFMGASVDDGNLTDEVNEFNNRSALPDPFVVTPSTDYVVTRAVATSQLIAGRVATFEIEIQNVGTHASWEESYMAVWLSPDPVINAQDMKLSGRVIPNLAPGEVHTELYSSEVPGYWSGGTFWAAGVADVHGWVTEIDETNNQLVIGQLELLPRPPDLGITSTGQRLAVGDCSAPLAIEIQSPDDGTPTTVLQDSGIALGSNTGEVVFFSDAACTVAVPSFVIPAGASSGSVHFRSSVGGAHTLEVSDPTGWLAPTSQGVTFTAGAPAQLAFATHPPVSVGLGEGFAVTVEVQDAWGNREVSGGRNIALALTGSGGGRLTGAVSGTDTNGRATFRDLRVDAPGTYVLSATSDGLGSTSSNGFGVVSTATPPVIATTASPLAAVGVPYAFDEDGAASATGSAPMTWVRVSGPDAFRVDAATGRISWVPDAEGTASVTLRATNPGGTDEYSFDVDVAASAGPPTAALTLSPASGDAPLVVQADGSGSAPAAGGALVGWEWDFGDGSPRSYGESVSHVFGEPGSYVVRLTARDERGASDIASEVVSVGRDGAAPPRARIIASDIVGSGSLSVTLSCECSAGDAPIVAYRWEYGDSVVTGDEVTVDFGPGGHEVRLTVTDSAGLTGRDRLTVTVDDGGNLPPVVSAQATPLSGPAPLFVQYVASFVDPDGEVVSVEWTFDDGAPSSSPFPVRVHDTVGVHGATVRVRDTSGLETSARLEVTVTAADGGRPPQVVSLPALAAAAGAAYRYDDDGLPAARGDRPLTWTLGKVVGSTVVGAPEGMVVDPVTGELVWTPSAAQIGEVDVALVATNSAGVALHEWTVTVTGDGPEPPDTSGEGCGCGVGSGSRGMALLAWALGLAVLARRRRAARLC